ncbi:MAG: malate synthase A [Saprospiraceae bacterium]|nr:malate synthase A [Saprospiraceae bacterium]
MEKNATEVDITASEAGLNLALETFATATATDAFPKGLALADAVPEAYSTILTPGALDFLSELHRAFNARRLELLRARVARQARLDAGELPSFPRNTQEIRETAWQVAPLPPDLQDRRVEITGPTDRKMIINALNSGARVFMADCEDSLSPSWANIVQGQINLFEAVRGTLHYTDPVSGKAYRLNPQTAVLMVRPRGWHLQENHIRWYGEPMSGSLVDFGLYFFHNAQALLDKGTAPYFYLPKLENALEAQLWNDVFVFAQQRLGIPQGTIKATVLIETILAAFELDEILYALREHAAGLNCGRWDYIFSLIKKFRAHEEFLLPDRSAVTMTVPFMRAYSLRVIQVCHRRGCHAIGGMAAQIPIKSDPAANEAALAKVRADKLREVQDGHDGTWVAHPGLVPVATDIFNAYMPEPNQIGRLRDDLSIQSRDLLEMPPLVITEAGVRQNINVGVLYLENWLRGNGCVALYNLMEDAATAEISRAQLWQWLHHEAHLQEGPLFSAGLYARLRDEELAQIRATVGEDAWKTGRFDEAVRLFDQMVNAPVFTEFLTLPAYDMI